MNLFNKDQSSSLCRPQWGGTGATKWWRKNWVLLVIIKAVGWRSNLSRLILCLILFMAVRFQGSTNLEPYRAKLKVSLFGSSIFFAIIYLPYLDSKHMGFLVQYTWGLPFPHFQKRKHIIFYKPKSISFDENSVLKDQSICSWTNLDCLGPFWTIFIHFGPFWPQGPFWSIFRLFGLLGSIVDPSTIHFRPLWTNLECFGSFGLFRSYWTIWDHSRPHSTNLDNLGLEAVLDHFDSEPWIQLFFLTCFHFKHLVSPCMCSALGHHFKYFSSHMGTPFLSFCRCCSADLKRNRAGAACHWLC